MNRYLLSRGVWPSLLVVCVCIPSLAQEPAADGEALKKVLEKMETFERQLKEKDEKIESLEKRVEELQEGRKSTPREQRSALLEAVEQMERDRAKEAAGKQPALVSAPIGSGSNVRLIDISLDVLFAAGGSTERDESLANLQGGGHDPRKRGFTMQNAELSLTGAVDPYLYGEAHIIYFIDPIEGETVVELEEAFAQTQTLPAGLQVEAGQMFTEFGRINPQHPHQWHWLDQPVINTRVFGPDGMRQTGVRLGWLTPLPWFSEFHFGVQNANGETMASFLANDEFYGERAVGGRPFVERDVRDMGDMVYLMRWVNSWELNEELTLSLGASALFGPNASGLDADTTVYGADALVKWRPRGHDRGWPFVSWQTEIIARDFDAGGAVHPGTDGELGTLDDVLLPSDNLYDWGFYTQVLYGFRPGWAAGVRYDFATGFGDSVDENGAFMSHNDDPFRDERHRISPLISWQPTEFSRFRLQYNYDMAEHLESGDAHSLWFGMEFLFGAHPAHSY